MSKIWNNNNKYIVNVIIVCIILLSFNIGISVTNIELDPSWINAYNYFFYKDLQYGNDIIYTYGPLGAFFLHGYDEGLFFVKIFCRCFLYIAVYSIIYHLMKKYNYKIGILFLIIFFFNTRLSVDYYLYFIELYIFYILLNKKSSTIIIIISTILLSILANYKFTFFLLNIGAGTIVFINLLVNNKFETISKIVMFTIIEYLIIWIILGQKIENFISYTINYFNISVLHYLEAMASEDMKHGYWYIGIAIIISIFLLYKFIQVIIISKKINKKEWFKDKKIYIWGLIIFFNWILFKYGFGRHDFHQHQYWIHTSFMCTFIFYIMRYELNIKKKIGIIVMMIISCISMIIPQYEYHPEYSIINKNIDNITENIKYITFKENIFNKKEELLEQYKEEKQKNKLYQISSIVKDNTVDIYNYQQNYVLFNELNWKPRPIFQSYLVHSQYLMNKNYQFLEKEPSEYILFKVQTIDNRLPLMADNLWIRDVLYNYDFVMKENDILLLKKKNTWIDINNNIEKIKTQDVGFEQNIDLNNKTKFTSININYSLLGKMIGFLYKVPTINIELELETGEKVEKRIIADMIKSPVYIANLIDNNQDLLSVMSGDISHKKVKSIRIKKPRYKNLFFDDKIEVNFYDVDNLNKWNIQ